MKKQFSIIVLGGLFISLTSGIYRHDRPIEKYLTIANQEEFNCVGQVLNLVDHKWEANGSFVLIDSVTILSAAHCFEGDFKKDTIVEYQGKKIKTYISKGKYVRDVSAFRFMVMNNVLEAKSIIVHPNYLKNGSCDLAIIKLNKPLLGMQKLQLNHLPNEIKDTVIGVGYGVSGPANHAALVNNYHVKIAGENIIDSVGGSFYNGQGSILFADVDCPDCTTACNKLGDSMPLDLEYSIGAGDSGGPLFTYIDNKLTLVGIACYAPKTISNLITNGYYCELNGWTRIAIFADWIMSNK